MVQTADTKLEKRRQPKSATASKAARSMSSDIALITSEDVCIVDSDSEAEDFSSKTSKKTLNNNEAVKASRRSKVKPLKNKESVRSETSVSSEQQEDGERHLSTCKDKATDSTSKKSRGKNVKDKDAGLSGSKSKSKSAHEQVMLFFVAVFLVKLN